MTCPPKLADLNRTVIEAIPVDRSNGWWTGLVRDRYTPTGELVSGSSATRRAILRTAQSTSGAFERLLGD